MLDYRRSYYHMDFFSSRLFENIDDLFRSRTSYYGVVYKYYSLSLNVRFMNIQFYLYAILSERLRRLNKSTSDVSVLLENVYIRYTRTCGVPSRGNDCRIGNSCDHIGVDFFFLDLSASIFIFSAKRLPHSKRAL